jgi:hypothetical protein
MQVTRFVAPTLSGGLADVGHWFPDYRLAAGQMLAGTDRP